VHVAGVLLDHGAQKLVQIDLKARFGTVHALRYRIRPAKGGA